MQCSAYSIPAALNSLLFCKAARRLKNMFDMLEQVKKITCRVHVWYVFQIFYDMYCEVFLDETFNLSKHAILQVHV